MKFGKGRPFRWFERRWLIAAAAIFIFFTPTSAIKTADGFWRVLRLGDSGEDVRRLQQILNTDNATRVALSGPGAPGQETSFFGPLTQSAVIRFQEKHKEEILQPIGLTRGTGFVGEMTLKKLAALSARSVPPAIGKDVNQQDPSAPPLPPLPSAPLPEINPAPTSTETEATRPPKVTGVRPTKVKAGDLVTVTGDGFTKTGNTVYLHYGLIEKKFENLDSPDGQTISFQYQPPEVRQMTESEILALPPEITSNIINQIKAAGGTLAQALNPYEGIKSEEELAALLEKNGRSLDDLNDFFYVTVENKNGRGSSSQALLWGMRKLPFVKSEANLKNNQSNLANLAAPETILKKLKEQIKSFFGETAFAVTPGGGFHTGIVMYCTCSGGHLSFAIDYRGAATGLLFFPPGFQPSAGSGFIASPWLGKVLIGAGSCEIFVGISCIHIYSNLPFLPWGAAL
jgi:peptidoglycan hydrolase-like protein with peptidoglycan-binding domain